MRMLTPADPQAAIAPLRATVVTGQEGEETACRYLEALGYTVLGRNLRLGRGEVDILAHDPMDDVLVFAEVKTRRRNTAYRPELNLTPRKQLAMLRAAWAWVNANDYEGAWRMDLLCVAAGKVTDHFRELECEEEDE